MQRARKQLQSKRAVEFNFVSQASVSEVSGMNTVPQKFGIDRQAAYYCRDVSGVVAGTKIGIAPTAGGFGSWRNETRAVC